LRIRHVGQQEVRGARDVCDRMRQDDLFQGATTSNRLPSGPRTVADMRPS
jgi:hypothetical protein